MRNRINSQHPTFLHLIYNMRVMYKCISQLSRFRNRELHLNRDRQQRMQKPFFFLATQRESRWLNVLRIAAKFRRDDVMHRSMFHVHSIRNEQHMLSIWFSVIVDVVARLSTLSSTHIRFIFMCCWILRKISVRCRFLFLTHFRTWETRPGALRN